CPYLYMNLYMFLYVYVPICLYLYTLIFTYVCVLICIRAYMPLIPTPTSQNCVSFGQAATGLTASLRKDELLQRVRGAFRLPQVCTFVCI
ncbi:hypothetical protein B484DRAFT_331744, partial [Ochromonadaceae sp. CCMP2298]